MRQGKSQAHERKIRRFSARIVASILFVLPGVAAADALSFWPSVEQLLVREAFVMTQTEGTSVACVVKTSVSSALVGEPFKLWWGSYGGDGVGWPQTGAYSIVVGDVSIREYKLTFNSPDGTSVACRTTVSVTQQ